jgi:hypothetical protein
VETRSRTWRKTTQEGESCGVSQLLDTSFVPGCELVKVVVVVVIVGQARSVGKFEDFETHFRIK